jgi:hypothetical protein
MVISCDVKMSHSDTQFDYVRGNVNQALPTRTLAVLPDLTKWRSVKFTCWEDGDLRGRQQTLKKV